MNKSKLRKIYLAKQMALSKPDSHDKSFRIKEKLFSNFDLEDVKVLHLFLSILEKGEINTSFIIDKFWKDFPRIKTAVPRVDFKRDVLEHLEYTQETELVKNHWGIYEPIGEKLLDEKKFEVILVPMLAFDERGYRVGHGKGYYDKFLSLCRKDTRKIGLSFFEPVREVKDIEHFDIRLNFCITPDQIFSF